MSQTILLPFLSPRPGNCPLFRQLRPETALLSPGQATNMTGAKFEGRRHKAIRHWQKGRQIEGAKVEVYLRHRRKITNDLKRGLHLFAHAASSPIATGAIVLSLYLFFGA